MKQIFIIILLFISLKDNNIGGNQRLSIETKNLGPDSSLPSSKMSSNDLSLALFKNFEQKRTQQF